MFPKLLSILLLLAATGLQAQTCTTPGQNPATAFPVCGTNTFTQNNVPLCGGRRMIVPCNDGGFYQDINPFWYKFTCFTAGTLVFTIRPHGTTDDYDWQLFDITGRNPNDVYTDASLFVCCNWSGYSGTTGTNLTATNNIACSGNNPIFSKAPTLIAGHEYILLVSNFSSSQRGYDLAFGGGTASITDTAAPRLQSAVPSCDGRTITVKLNKRMKCSSLTTTGSDFGIAPAAPVAFAAVTGVGCSTGFDTDSIILTLQSPLNAGNYQLLSKNGTDGNTLLDNCGTAIQVGNAVPFVIAPNQPTTFDSLAPVGCAPQTLNIIFRKPVRCSSIATDGSDFRIDGTPAANIASVASTCNSNGLTTSVQINLNAPLQTAGNYSLVLRTGSDGNTIVDECGLQIPAAQINFSTKDTVSAEFTYSLFLDCDKDSVAFLHDGRNGVTSWRWLFDNSRTSSLQNPQITYTIFGQKTARLIVANGTCADTATASFNLDNYLEAKFGGPSVLCPKDTAYFTDSSLGKIRRWQWSFGNGNSSTLKQPPAQVYPPANLQVTYNVQLVVEDSIGCTDTLTKKIVIVNNCYIDVPTAFTPNGDGLNDYLYPLNAYKATALQFQVYNRFGQLVWQTSDWTRKWDGRINGQLPETGTYVWVLSYTHLETGQKIQLQGTTVLIR